MVLQSAKKMTKNIDSKKQDSEKLEIVIVSNNTEKDLDNLNSDEHDKDLDQAQADPLLSDTHSSKEHGIKSSVPEKTSFFKIVGYSILSLGILVGGSYIVVFNKAEFLVNFNQLISNFSYTSTNSDGKSPGVNASKFVNDSIGGVKFNVTTNADSFLEMEYEAAPDLYERKDYERVQARKNDYNNFIARKFNLADQQWGQAPKLYESAKELENDRQLSGAKIRPRSSPPSGPKQPSFIGCLCNYIQSFIDRICGPSDTKRSSPSGPGASGAAGAGAYGGQRGGPNLRGGVTNRGGGVSGAGPTPKNNYNSMYGSSSTVNTRDDVEPLPGLGPGTDRVQNTKVGVKGNIGGGGPKYTWEGRRQSMGRTSVGQANSNQGRRVSFEGQQYPPTQISVPYSQRPSGPSPSSQRGYGAYPPQRGPAARPYSA